MFLGTLLQVESHRKSFFLLHKQIQCCFFSLSPSSFSLNTPFCFPWSVCLSEFKTRAAFVIYFLSHSQTFQLLLVMEWLQILQCWLWNGFSYCSAGCGMASVTAGHEWLQLRQCWLWNGLSYCWPWNGHASVNQKWIPLPVYPREHSNSNLAW